MQDLHAERKALIDQLMNALTNAVVSCQTKDRKIDRGMLLLAAMKFAAQCGAVFMSEVDDERREMYERYARTLVKLAEAEILKGDQLTKEEMQAITKAAYGKAWEEEGETEFVLPMLPGVH